MPWCPKCKAEYQEGFTVCSDCDVELVDELENAKTFIPFVQLENKKVAEKLAKFFEYSALDCELSYDEQNELYVISIPPKYEKEATKLYEAFYYVEADMARSKKSMAKEISDESDDTDDNNEDSSVLNEEYEENQYMESEEDSFEEEDEYAKEVPSDDISSYDAKDNGSVYVMKADQYKDLSGSVWIFLIFGVAGLIFVVLNIAGVLTIFNGWISNTVMGALFLLFIYIALSTNQKAKKIQSEIDAENKLTEKINNWLKLNVTERFLDSIGDDSISEELNYIKKIDTIKEMLLKEFGSQNLAYLDRLIDEFYNSTFDKEEE